MTTPQQKGWKAEARWVALKRSQGWEVEPVRRSRFHHGDMFQVADAIGFRGLSSGGQLIAGQWAVWQVKCSTADGGLAQLRAKAFPPGTLKEVAILVEDPAGDYFRVLDAAAPPLVGGKAPCRIEAALPLPKKKARKKKVKA